MKFEVGMLMPMAVIFVGVCAIMAAFGFRDRVTTVGIDLGTTYSVVGINDNGKVIIIPDEAGHLIFPSIVHYKDDGGILVAYEARQKLSCDPLRTIYNAKRFIGRGLDDDQVKLYANEHPFTILPINSTVSNFSQVGFELPTGRLISPEQVGCDVLGHLLKVASRYLRHKQVNKAVIAVPAKFNAEQRRATGEAYRKAGLKVVRVIEEPTAAAVAYRLHKQAGVHHILVYDFGGGTLDVSLLYVASGSVQVYATDGDETLGGSDIDLCLFQQLRQAILDQWETTSDSDSSSVKEVEDCSVAVLLQQAEAIKRSLTSRDQAAFTCRLTDPKQLLSSHHKNEIEQTFDIHSSRVLTVALSRVDHLEHGCRELFDRALLPVQRLLEQLNMQASDIEEVVLVGGSTRIPKVKQLLRSFFGKQRLNDHIDPDITVAYGAASILQ
jgi:molecular chaperone DnaK (HSP70)